MIDALFAPVGEALVRASGVAFVVVAASALLLWFLRRLPPFAVALIWWLVALRVLLELAGVAGVALPLLDPAAGSAPAIVRELESGDATWAPPRQSAAPSPAIASTTASSTAWTPAWTPAWSSSPSAPGALALLALVWGAGFVLLLAFELRRGWRFAQVVRRAAAADAPELLAAHRDALATLGLSRSVPLLVSEEIAMPMVVGVVSPRLLLPAEPRLTGEELRLVLLHELAHVGRRDALRALVPALARRLFWFHPLVRFAEREYALAAEAACDALVLAKTGAAPKRYGRLLIRFSAQGDAGVATAWAFAACPAGNRGNRGNRIQRRIQMLVSKPLARRQLLVALPLVALVALAIALPVRLVAAAPAPPVVALASLPLPDVAAPLAELPAPPELLVAAEAPSGPRRFEAGTRFARAPLAPVPALAPRATTAPTPAPFPAPPAPPVHFGTVDLPESPATPSAPGAVAPPAPRAIPAIPALPSAVAPPAPPTPPAPPSPPAWRLDSDEALVFIDGDSTSTINATAAERRLAKELARDGEPVLLVRRDGATRILRDRESIDEVRRWVERSMASAALHARDLEAAAEDLSRRFERQQAQLEERAQAMAERLALSAESTEALARERAERLSAIERLAADRERTAQDSAHDAERQVAVARREIERQRVLIDREVARHAARVESLSVRETERLEREIERQIERQLRHREAADLDLEELLDRLLGEGRRARPK